MMAVTIKTKGCENGKAEDGCLFYFSNPSHGKEFLNTLRKTSQTMQFEVEIFNIFDLHEFLSLIENNLGNAKIHSFKFKINF